MKEKVGESYGFKGKRKNVCAINRFHTITFNDSGV